MIDRYQLAAARGMLGWTLKELSAKTNITIEAIHKFETGVIETPRKSTLTALQDVFENNGIEFTEQSGVRKKSRQFTVSSGVVGVESMYNQIYDYARLHKGAADLLCCGFRLSQMASILSDAFIQSHADRMHNVGHGVFFKTLIDESAQNEDRVLYSDYRVLPSEYFYGAPFYVYGDTVSIVVMDDTLQTVSMQNKIIAELYRRQFAAMWKLASLLKGAPNAS